MNRLNFLPASAHPSWENFLGNYRLAQLASIEQQIGASYLPARDQVLRFLQVDLSATKVVILGQDPYPQPGMATGRAFEVAGLDSWFSPFRQISLRNILRLLYRTYRGIDSYQDLPSFSQIRELIRTGDFDLLPPSRLFDSWERQGVLLLNTYLTVRPGEPLSHKSIWLDFARELVQFVSWQRTDLYWFLWGKNAQEFMPFIDLGTCIPSRHPMMCSEKYEDDFLRSDCFSETKHLVNWLG